MRKLRAVVLGSLFLALSAMASIHLATATTPGTAVSALPTPSGSLVSSDNTLVVHSGITSQTTLASIGALLCGGNCAASAATPTNSTWTNATDTTTYATRGTASLTTGISKGSTGAWIVGVKMTEIASVTSAQLCIESTTAGTNGVGSFATGAGVVCNATPTNQLAGATNPSVSTFEATYLAQYANSTSITFTCASRNTSATAAVSGSCYIFAEYPI